MSVYRVVEVGDTVNMPVLLTTTPFMVVVAALVVPHESTEDDPTAIWSGYALK